MIDTVPLEAMPVSGSTTTSEPAEGPVKSPGPGRSPPQFDTYALSFNSTMVNGEIPTSISASIEPLARLTTASVLLRLNAT